MKKFVPETVFKSFKGTDHGEMALFYLSGWHRSFLNCNKDFDPEDDKCLR